MSTATLVRPASHRLLGSVMVANGAVVSTLHWSQALLPQVAQELGGSDVVRSMPGAALAGYALGVAVLGACVRDLTTSAGLLLHVTILTLGLCLTASAPDAPFALAGAFTVGVGCSLTQRLLASVASATPASARGETIGWIIAAGLVGIVVARAGAPMLSVQLGWRATFWLGAVLVAVAGAAATAVLDRRGIAHGPVTAMRTPSLVRLWVGAPVLRRAAAQQAAVFAAFSLGWAAFPRLIGADAVAACVLIGAVACVGAGAAVLAGRACSRIGPDRVAPIGVTTALTGLAAVLTSGWSGAGIGVAMALVEAGTQVALVANHARAQALTDSPALRGRLAAIVTAVGFAGGALGAVIGNRIG